MLLLDYIVYDIWIAFELAVVYFLFVETGNLSLKQTAAVLDGEPIQEKMVEEVARAVESQNHSKKIAKIGVSDIGIQVT